MDPFGLTQSSTAIAGLLKSKATGGVAFVQANAGRMLVFKRHGVF